MRAVSLATHLILHIGEQHQDVRVDVDVRILSVTNVDCGHPASIQRPANSSRSGPDRDCRPPTSPHRPLPPTTNPSQSGTRSAGDRGCLLTLSTVGQGRGLVSRGVRESV